jgi:hypothetical protein
MITTIYDDNYDYDGDDDLLESSSSEYDESYIEVSGHFAIENEIQSVTDDTDSQEIIENLSDPLIKTLAHVKLFEIAENDAMIKVQLERLRFKEAWSNLLN